MSLFVVVTAGKIFGWTKLPFVVLMAAPEALTLWVWFLGIQSLATFSIAWSGLIDVINVAGLLFSSNDCAVLFSGFCLATHANGICECEV